MGRPTTAMHGFHRARLCACHSGRKAYSPPLLRDDQHRRAATAPARRPIARAVGRQAQHRLAVVAREPVHRAFGIAEHDRRADRPAAQLRSRYSSFSLLQATSPLGGAPGGDAVAGVGADDDLVVAGDAVGAADVLASTAASPRSASTQPTAAWKARAQSTSPIRTAAPPDRPGARPRWCRAARPPAPPSARVPRSGSSPASRAPCPTTSVSLNGSSTPACASVSGSPGRLQRPQACGRPARRRPARCGRAPSTKTRSPATSGAVATRVPSGLAPGILAGVEHDQFVVARHHGGEAAIAADAGAELAAHAGAPQLAAGVGLQREHRAVAIGHA